MNVWEIKKPQSCIIRNVKIKDLNISLYVGARVTCGGIVGNNSGLVENCSVEGSITLRQSYLQSAEMSAGGIVGYSHSEIVNCYSNVEIDATTTMRANVGGISAGIGETALIKNCYSVGNIRVIGNGSHSSEDVYIYAGGIISAGSGRIENCFSMGDVTTQSASSYYGYAGHIIAYGTGNCLNNYLSTQRVVPTSPGNGFMIPINNSGTALEIEKIKSEEFIYDTLGWSRDIWIVQNGILPMLKF